MSTTALGSAQQPPFPAVGGTAAVSSGVRQALALVDGARETTDTVQREAKFVERRTPAPFSDNKVDVRAAAQEAAQKAAAARAEQSGSAVPVRQAAPADQPKPADDTRKLSLTGQPAVEKAESQSGRGNLVDIET